MSLEDAFLALAEGAAASEPAPVNGVAGGR
jgi:hypothetical protein